MLKYLEKLLNPAVSLTSRVYARVFGRLMNYGEQGNDPDFVNQIWYLATDRTLPRHDRVHSILSNQKLMKALVARNRYRYDLTHNLGRELVGWAGLAMLAISAVFYFVVV